MDERRAVAQLPGLELELRHKKVPEDRAEYLALTLKATPDFDTVAAWLAPWRAAQAFWSLNPFVAMALAANPFLRTTPPPAALPRGSDPAASFASHRSTRNGTLRYDA